MHETDIIQTQQQALINLRDYFNANIKFIADRTYLQDLPTTPQHMNPEDLANRQFSALLKQNDDAVGRLISRHKTPRDVHGVMHATRVASYIDILHKFKSTQLLDQQNKSDLFPNQAIQSLAVKFHIQPEDILTLTKYAAFFHDSAREAEGEDYWDHRSAENCYEFLKYKGISEDVARFFATAAKFKSDPEKFQQYCKNEKFTPTDFYHYIRQLIQTADGLDVMRCRDVFEAKYYTNFLKHTQENKDSISQQNQQSVNALMANIRDFISMQESKSPCSIKVADGTLGRSTIVYNHSGMSKLDFEHQTDPFGVMQQQITSFGGYLSWLVGDLKTYKPEQYISDVNQVTPSNTNNKQNSVTPLNSANIISEVNWGEQFKNNAQFEFLSDIQQDPQNSSNLIGHICENNSKSPLVNINKDCLDCPIQPIDDQPAQIAAIAVVLRALVTKHCENNTASTGMLNLEINDFSQEYLNKLFDYLNTNTEFKDLPITFRCKHGASTEIKELIETYNQQKMHILHANKMKP